MTANPFLTTSGFNLPLRLDLCRKVHCTALRAAVRGLHPDMVPDEVPVEQLRQWAYLNGPSTYLLHPADIERIFTGVTLTVYQAIESLYCTRIGRSIRMVWQILKKMALQANAAPLKYEAVWAICLYLEHNRADSITVMIERSEASWRIVRIDPNIPTRNRAGTIFQPAIICVLNTLKPKVLAFRIAEAREIDESVSLAIYDAIVSRRRPSTQGATGLVWSIPSQIVTDIAVSKTCQAACDQIGLGLKSSNGTSPLPLLDALHSDWARDLQGKVLGKSRLVTLFDNYLEKRHGYGPLKSQSWKRADFAHLVGYNADPAWQFSALRHFLPAHAGIIRDGAVQYDGLHYEDELLVYWPDQPVTLRRSEVEESTTWVYLADEILCQAMARELRRKDGSYRPSRPKTV